jgi:hypothetical protein
MRIAGVYSFNGGVETVSKAYPDLLTEVNAVIGGVDGSQHKTKESTEKTTMGQMLYSPKSLNKAFKTGFAAYGWQSVRVACEYPTGHYQPDYEARKMNAGAFREMDFVKERLGIEVQFSSPNMRLWSTTSARR